MEKSLLVYLWIIVLATVTQQTLGKIGYPAVTDSLDLTKDVKSGEQNCQEDCLQKVCLYYENMIRKKKPVKLMIFNMHYKCILSGCFLIQQ